MLNKSDRKLLLKLARESIAERFGGKLLNTDDGKLSEVLKTDVATFVTLTLDRQLRGCIGKTEAVKRLYLDVIENAKWAAFEDYRFPPVTKDEFEKIKIEISVLSPAQKLKYKSVEDLLKFLENEKPGLIISNGFSKATFLPQVWEEIKTPKEFLSHLCLKMGASADEWGDGKLEVSYYYVEKFSEDEP